MKRKGVILVVGLLAACGPDPVRPEGEVPLEPAEYPLLLVLPRNSGQGQVAPVASYLSNPLIVQVTRNGRPVAGVPVRWVSPNPTARVEPLSGVSDANGYVSARFFTATAAGEQNAIAILGNQWLGIPVSALPGPPTLLRPVTPVTDSSPLLLVPFYIRVKVEDQYGNGVPQVVVGWTMDPSPNIGFDQTSRPSNSEGVVASFVMFHQNQQNAILSARVAHHPAIQPVVFHISSF